MEDNNYALNRMAKKRAEKIKTKTDEEKQNEERANKDSQDYDIDRIMKVREMDDSLSDDQRASAKYRRELRERIAKKNKKK